MYFWAVTFIVSISTCTAADRNATKETPKLWITSVEVPYVLTYLNPGPNYLDDRSDPFAQCRFKEAWSIEPIPIGFGSDGRQLSMIDVTRTLHNEIPPHIFYHFCALVQFSMTHQHLKLIRADDFGFAGDLRYLNLSHNEIERIETDSLSVLRSIKEIDLSFNAIKYIADGVFQHEQLPHLKTLHLQNNKLTVPKWDLIVSHIVELTLDDHSGISSIKCEWIVESSHEYTSSYSYSYSSRDDRTSSLFVNISNNPLVRDDELANQAADSIVVGPIELVNITINAATKTFAAPFNRISDVSLEPADTYQLTSLNLSNNLITNISQISQFSQLTQLKEVDLSNNQIESLDDVPFAMQLRDIHLQHNKLSVIRFEQFHSEIAYKYTMTDRYFAFIECHIYQPYFMRRNINLTGNPWVNSSDAVRVKAHNVNLRNNGLESVVVFSETSAFDASHNRISRLILEDADRKYRMNIMDLSHNLLTSASLSDLSKLNDLGTIDLSFNKITTVDGSSLPLVKLRRIDLSNNQIAVLKWEEIIPYAFEYTLLDNSLSRIESGPIEIDPADALTYYETSEPVTIYRYLDISNNTFVNSSDAIRVNADSMIVRSNSVEEIVIYPQTRRLGASNNRISKLILEDDAGHGFNLTLLELSKNRLTSISALAKLHKLERIDLSSNRLETLNLTEFSALKHLQWISFKNNQLTRLSTGFMFNTAQLEYLDISYNSLVQFRMDGLFPRLQELHIEGNNLTEIDIDVKRKASKLIKFGLNENHWDCNYLTKSLLLINFEDMDYVTDQPIVHTERSYSGSVSDIFCFDENEASVPEAEKRNDASELSLKAQDVENSKLDRLKTEIVAHFNEKLNEKFVDLNAKFVDLNEKFVDLNEKLEKMSKEFNEKIDELPYM